MAEPRSDTDRRKIAVARLSVLSNTVLVIAKLLVGLAIGSVSVLSEAIHSGVDLVAAVVALLAVRSAGKPPDREHPWGHGKIENVSGAFEALLIFVAALWITREAMHKLLGQVPVENAGAGVAVMALSAGANWVVSERLFRVGRETESVALQADGWHLRTDVWTSAGVTGGLALMALAGWLLPGVPVWWIDPVAAIAVALLIVKTAWTLTAQSLRDVLDSSLPGDEVDWIRRRVAEEPGVRGVHGLRTRRSGASRFVEFHMLVDGGMATSASHDMTERVSDALEARFPGAHVTVHVEPCDGSCKPECVEGCLLDAERRIRVRAEAGTGTGRAG